MAPLPERSETMTQRTLVQAGSPNLEKVVDTHEASGDPLDAPAGPIQLEQALAAAHLYHAKDVLAALASDADEGLRDAEVTQRSEQYGPNMLQGGDDISIWNIFVHQIANAMTLVSTYCRDARCCQSGGVVIRTRLLRRWRQRCSLSRY